ncbi:MAG: tetraacyldisaccharide 4'-kinase [Deltaproteobacteria bacterium]|nr:tetraacyldisaccharide 4'-kinase [Deltaproteobacteria bacterium]
MSGLAAMWWRQEEPPLQRLLLAPLALPEALFRAGVALRNALYDRGLRAAARAGAPVLSVGNLAVGGSGKTPAALEVARRLAARGRQVALLSRGYGASRSDARVVADGSRVLLGAEEAGDEPLLLARRLPGLRVLCGPRRAELATLAVERLAADALVLDDGFQHRALARDLDLVVFDGANPWGNGRLLPRGPNREGRGALRRGQLCWISRVDQAAAPALERLRALAREATGRPPVESRHAVADVLDGALSRSVGKGALAGQRLLLLSGIGRPEGFRRTVEVLGGTVAAERAFADHHRFADAELSEAFAAARAAGCDGVATTEKDAVRLSTRWAAEAMLKVVRIEAEVVSGGEELDRAIDGALARWKAG